MYKNKRHKAWIGAAIGAATSIASALFGNKAKKEAERKNAIAQNRTDTLQMAAALTNKYGDQSYVDDYYDRVSFRLGGIKRKRKANGGYENTDSNEEVYVESPVRENSISDEALDAGISTIGDIVPIVTETTPEIISKTPIINGTPKTKLATRGYNVNNYIDRQQILRCGGRKRIK